MRGEKDGGHQEEEERRGHDECAAKRVRGEEQRVTHERRTSPDRVAARPIRAAGGRPTEKETSTWKNTFPREGQPRSRLSPSPASAQCATSCRPIRTTSSTLGG